MECKFLALKVSVGAEQCDSGKDAVNRRIYRLNTLSTASQIHLVVLFISPSAKGQCVVMFTTSDL